MKYYGLIMPSVFPTGVFIQDIKQTATSNESEGINTMTVTLTNLQKAHFNIKNGKSGSVLEATEKMKKDAKDYIASELAAQKAALESAIKNAKTALNNTVHETKSVFKQQTEKQKQELSTLITEAETILQEMIKNSEAGYKNITDAETLKIKEAAKKAISKIEQSIKQAAADLDNKGGEIIMKAKQEMTEHLDKFGSSITKKIEETGYKIFNNIKDNFDANIELLTKISGNMEEFTNKIFYADSIDNIIIQSKNKYNVNTEFLIKAQSLRGKPLICRGEDNAYKSDKEAQYANETVINTKYLPYTYNNDKSKARIWLQGNTIENLFIDMFSVSSPSVNFTIFLTGFRFLKNIYIASNETMQTIMECFKITDLKLGLTVNFKKIERFDQKEKW